MAFFKHEMAGWSTGLTSYLECKECCRIHTPVGPGMLCEDGVSGCAGWKPGFHRSVAVLYDAVRHNKYCHATYQQLALDKVLARRALDPSDQSRAHEGFPWQVGKFMRCNFATVAAYGRGYCYLRAFPATVRHRVARVLGPVPYVADVLRVLAIVGFDRKFSCAWQKVGGDMCHVVPGSSGVDVNPVRFFHVGVGLVREMGPSVRVGLDVAESFDGDVGHGEDVVYARCRSDGLVAAFTVADIRSAVDTMVGACRSGDMSGRVKLSVGHCGGPLASMFPAVNYEPAPPVFGGGARVLSLVRKLEGFMGCSVPREAWAPLAAVTTHSSLYGAVDSVFKVTCRNYELVGDAFIRQVMALGSLSSYLRGVEYSACMERATNANLARVLVASGLRAYCSVGALGERSSANADILEALIGVCVFYCEYSGVVNLLCALDIVPLFKLQVGVVSVESGVGDGGLTSSQVAMAMKFKAVGLLGA